MKTIFKQLKFNRRQERYNKTIQETQFEFYVPGVNSGIYKPASLHFSVFIKETNAGLFKFTKNKSYFETTLSVEEFDELFAEMEKIKKLRDMCLTVPG